MIFDLPPDPPKFWLPEKPTIIRSASAIAFPMPAIIRLRGDADFPTIIIQSLLPGMVHCGASGAELILPPQREWTSGTHDWTVPAGVTEICAVCVGAGGYGLNDANGGSGGAGGDLRYRNAIAVTPGEVLTIIVGSGTSFTTNKESSISRGGTKLLSAAGGGRGVNTGTTVKIGISTTIGGDVGGGNGGTSSSPTNNGSAGGAGAGGYAGNGGNGGAQDGGDGSNGAGGGGGGGGGGPPNANGGAGGGVGLKGQGSNGPGGSGFFVSPGTGGSGGSSGTTFAGGNYGGGGRGYDGPSASGLGGGAGGVRVIWGEGRAYPSTNTGDIEV